MAVTGPEHDGANLTALVPRVNRRDAERQRSPSHVREAGGAHARRELLLDREVRHRRGRYAYAVRCPLTSAPICGSSWWKYRWYTARTIARARRRELENHEPRPGLEHAGISRSAAVQVDHVANAERHDRPRDAVIGDRQLQRVGSHRRDDRRRRLSDPARSIGSAKSAPITRPANPGTARQFRRTSSVPAHRSRYVPVGARSQLERRDRASSPRLVDVEAEEVVEQIVARRDLREDPLHVRALLVAARGRCLRLGRLRLTDGHRESCRRRGG